MRLFPTLCALLLSLGLATQAHAGRRFVHSFDEDPDLAAGDVLQIALPVYAYGLTAWNNDWDGAVEFTESLACTEGTVGLLKATIPARRPDGGAHSFPSGHTAASFVSADFVRVRYGWEYSVPAFVGAGFVGWNREHEHKHYWRDVGAGAAIGVAWSEIFTDRYPPPTLTSCPRWARGRRRSR